MSRSAARPVTRLVTRGRAGSGGEGGESGGRVWANTSVVSKLGFPGQQHRQQLELREVQDHGTPLRGLRQNPWWGW